VRANSESLSMISTFVLFSGVPFGSLILLADGFGTNCKENGLAWASEQKKKKAPEGGTYSSARIGRHESRLQLAHGLASFQDHLGKGGCVFVSIVCRIGRMLRADGAGRPWLLLKVGRYDWRSSCKHGQSEGNGKLT